MCPTIPAKKAKNINISLVRKVPSPNSEISALHAMISDMDKIQNPNSNQPTLTLKDVRGLELGEEIRIWKEVASSEARLTIKVPTPNSEISALYAMISDMDMIQNPNSSAGPGRDYAGIHI